ncbi:NAD(P)-dependent alcohol dehydrogenase [Umezawaea sp. Da 62-37]|uniref:NAD(P)-dependent alcohol dehydrogenase n=1 Tax=Umezawaea sp. Da 62-37 TaxID=3075927 RepID=UPI0028F7156F|nr:NAD(P)-dependent alcohol dehydrogenase [Umezawaea sp. Da 62-37]WNV86403.1 NAD(P)-dependent alcohol dehydrogenase [Umezawaea sp. Da 62-37]
MAGEMRAALFDRYGAPEVLYEGRVPVPVAKADEVLVRVHGTSVNGGELYARRGRLGILLGRRFPKRIGIDFAGEVVQAAATGRGPEVGAHVWGSLPRGRFGSAAEFVAVHVRQVARSPRGLDLVEASALPVGTTAITALRDKARLKPGERLLVRGGAGGVGYVAVQLGKAMGAHVTALASAKNLDLVHDLGADEAFDYATTGPAELGSFDVVMDTAGSSLPAYRRLLGPGGRMVSIAFDSPATVAYILGSVVFGSRRVRFFSGNPRHDLFRDLTAYVESGALRPAVDTTRPLADIAGAHRALEAGGVRGKHVVRVV